MVDASRLMFRVPMSTSWIDAKTIRNGPKEIMIPFEQAKIYTPEELRHKDMVKVRLFPNTIIEMRDTRSNKSLGLINYEMARAKYC